MYEIDEEAGWISVRPDERDDLMSSIKRKATSFRIEDIRRVEVEKGWAKIGDWDDTNKFYVRVTLGPEREEKAAESVTVAKFTDDEDAAFALHDEILTLAKATR